MLNRNIKLGFVYNALFTGINLLFPFITFPYALHILGPDGIGKSQFAFSFAQYFTIIAAIGIPVYGIREVARCKDDQQKISRLFSELIIINGITCLSLSSVYIVIIYCFDYFSTDRSLYTIGVTLLLFSFLAIEWLYTGLSNFKSLAIRTAVVKAVSLVLMFVLVQTEADYINYLLLNIGAIIAGNFINVWMIRHTVKFTIRGLNLKQHIVPLLLVFGISIGSSMYTVLDTVLLGFLSQPKFVGFYTCAVKFAKMFMPVVAMIGSVLMPEISKRITRDDLAEGEHLLRQSFLFITFLSVPVSFGFYILAPEFISVFSGDGFEEAVDTMKILSALPFLLGMGYFFASQILFPSGRYREVLIATLIGLTLFICLNFILVPRFMQNGAAVANIISEMVVTLAYIYFVKKHYAIHIDIKNIITTGLSCLAFFPITYVIRLLHLTTTLTFTLSVIMCGLAYLLAQWLIFKNTIIDNLFVFVTRGAKQGIEKLYR